jgi:hypothetical protein
MVEEEKSIDDDYRPYFIKEFEDGNLCLKFACVLNVKSTLQDLINAYNDSQKPKKQPKSKSKKQNPPSFIFNESYLQKEPENDDLEKEYTLPITDLDTPLIYFDDELIFILSSHKDAGDIIKGLLS